MNLSNMTWNEIVVDRASTVWFVLIHNMCIMLWTEASAQQRTAYSGQTLLLATEGIFTIENCT